MGTWAPIHWLAALVSALIVSLHCAAISLEQDGYHVRPGDEIQAAIEQAAGNPTNKAVWVHAGTYHPSSKRQALIWLNRKHSGVHLTALGAVTLTAANTNLVHPQDVGFPAAVNHVVYFGDGIDETTQLDGFHITGANGFLTKRMLNETEPDRTVPRNAFLLTDGGGIKIFGRSYPVLSNLEIDNNYSSPCGGGISVQHQGFNDRQVVIKNCIFRSNGALATGSALDLLHGSAARIENCLFVGNSSNLGFDMVADTKSGELPSTNSGVLTIFGGSRGEAVQCTFTGNRNAVDDLSGKFRYTRCIFANNTLMSGLPNTNRCEILLLQGGIVTGCVIQGRIDDPKGSISPRENALNPGPPEFDPEFIPKAPAYSGAGWRKPK